MRSLLAGLISSHGQEFINFGQHLNGWYCQYYIGNPCLWQDPLLLENYICTYALMNKPDPSFAILSTCQWWPQDLHLTWRKSCPSKGQICKKQLLFLQWSSRHLARMTTTCAPQPCHWAQTCPIWCAQLHNNNKSLSMRENEAFYFWSRMCSCHRVVQAREKSFEWTPSSVKETEVETCVESTLTGQ